MIVILGTHKRQHRTPCILCRNIRLILLGKRNRAVLIAHPRPQTRQRPLGDRDNREPLFTFLLGRDAVAAVELGVIALGPAAEGEIAELGDPGEGGVGDVLEEDEDDGHGGGDDAEVDLADAVGTGVSWVKQERNGTGRREGADFMA